MAHGIQENAIYESTTLRLRSASSSSIDLTINYSSYSKPRSFKTERTTYVKNGLNKRPYKSSRQLRRPHSSKPLSKNKRRNHCNRQLRRILRRNRAITRSLSATTLSTQACSPLRHVRTPYRSAESMLHSLFSILLASAMLHFSSFSIHQISLSSLLSMLHCSSLRQFTFDLRRI